VRELPLSVAWLAGGAALLASGLAVAASDVALPAGVELAPRPGFATELPIAAQRFADVDGQPGEELVALGAAGEVRTWTLDGERRAWGPEPRGALALPDPAHVLAQVGRVLPGEPRPQLVVADLAGVRAWRALEDGSFGGEPEVLLPKYRQRLRVGAPRLASIVQDVDADGRDDLVLPAGDRLEVWVQAVATSAGAPDGAPRERFRRVASVHVELAHSRASSGDELSDVLSASLIVPDLALSDVNGDGRPDLMVVDGSKRAWHLVRADGTIPAESDVTLDLDLFKDTTPAASLAPGRTLAGGDVTRLETRDLDGDGILDNVIAHRRKVWVFPGTKDGPQFTTPSTILKAADDVTALLLVRLDGDERPDLLLFKLQIPSIAEILRGLLREWSIEAECIGYRNADGKSFATTPEWKSTIEVRLPAILEIARDPDAIVQRFEAVGKKFRSPALADLDGDGKGDVALVAEDKTALEVWRGATGDVGLGREDERLLKQILFEDENRTWDLDRVLTWMGGYAEQRVARITGGRAAEAKLALRDPALFTLAATRTADADGDGKAEIVLEYSEVAAPGRRHFDVYGVE
jgi:hypothetical protein